MKSITLIAILLFATSSFANNTSECNEATASNLLTAVTTSAGHTQKQSESVKASQNDQKSKGSKSN